MKWFEITVFTTQEGLEAVAARFDALGIAQVQMEESRESIAAFLESTAKYWDFADAKELASDEPCVKAYLADVPENRGRIEEIEASFAALRGEDVGLDLGSLRVVTGLRDEEDWANNWKLYYKPLPIGDRLMVCPSWEKVDAKGRALLSMDPGMAFGTGTHHTTRMCLGCLDELVREGDTVLDLGCGSGILSIAALLLGAKAAIGVDIDPMAEKIARENAQRNGIGADSYTVYAGDVLTDAALRETLARQQYDIVTANIVADVIIALCPLVKQTLKADGVLITSGIIADRLEDVTAALTENGLAILAVYSSEDWRAIKAKLV
ncbi:MAG: 50S ribosomal protein L11 methyltransferase [Clostridia bacterium]|nr:50S ribosomal protein L11 methyltransferase [Clostridia bacterium]